MVRNWKIKKDFNMVGVRHNQDLTSSTTLAIDNQHYKSKNFPVIEKE